MISNKELFYQNATQKLLRQLDSMKMTDTERHNAAQLVLIYRDSFKSNDVKRAVFGETLGDKIDLFRYPSDGFCKASCTAFIKAMDEKNWKLMYIDEIWTYGPHFFLYHVPSRQNFDLTADQYTVQGLDVPYYLGRPEKQIGKYMPYGQQFANSVAEYLNNVKQSGV